MASSSSANPNPPILLYIYPFSPYGRKITSYLSLRQIPYTEVHQPALPPRPDLDSLSIRYRRIPIASIGKDVYCDTKVILAKLEKLFPGSDEHPSLGAKDANGRAMEMLLEGWTTDTVFKRVVMCIPPEAPALSDKAFTKDRAELWGGTWSPEHQRRERPYGLQHLDDFFGFLETFADGGKDFAGGSSPGLADIHALTLFDWLLELVPGAIPESALQSHPRAAAWIQRYHDALAAAKSKLGDAPTLEGPAAKAQILKSDFAEPEGSIDENDPVVEASGLKKGEKVEVWPEDILAGYKNREIGHLVAVTKEEVVVTVETGLRVHFPRWNYRVQRVKHENGEAK